MIDMILCGADQLGENKRLFDGARTALVTTPTGRLGNGSSTIDELRKVSDLCALFGPEHGVRGSMQDAIPIADARDDKTGLPVYSLYGKDRRRMTEEMFDTFDILVYDIQDVGSRYYTFISTLLCLIEDCGRHGKKLVVLDRPDPLGGELIEGNILKDCETSFVGCYSLPNRYGMTAGEFADMANKEHAFGCDLTVIPCRGWKRYMLFPESGTAWIMPSPNIPNFETALLYVGACLTEGTNLSEGRGTANPFQLVGAPYIDDPEKLCRIFNEKREPGIFITPYYFTPMSSKHSGELCGGVHLHITDAKRIRPLNSFVRLLSVIRDLWPDDFAFLPPVFDNGRPFIRMLTGLDDFEDKDWTADHVLEHMDQGHDEFYRRRNEYEIYD